MLVIFKFKFDFWRAFKFTSVCLVNFKFKFARANFQTLHIITIKSDWNQPYLRTLALLNCLFKFILKLPEKCNFCDIVYSNRINQARHERIVHADEKGISVYRCSLCPVTRRQLSEFQSHLSDCHNRFKNLCHYCNLAFNDKNTSETHQKTTRVTCCWQLESWQPNWASTGTSSTTTTSATTTRHPHRRSLQSYGIVDRNNTAGLPGFMAARKNEINEIIEQKTLNKGPKKFYSARNYHFIKKCLTTEKPRILISTPIQKWHLFIVNCLTKRFFTWRKRCSLSSSCSHLMEVVGFFIKFCGLIWNSLSFR